ncbi:MAG: hypothetical protein EAX89_00005 [Candidatus Lokiarchaeota archaeon]|nr:hypothetical protein [Candidatus Lokiarchaeota archaeon]
MDINKKIVLGMITGVIILAFVYILLTFDNQGISPSVSGDLSFPFFFIFPGWFAIWIPILARKSREEQQRKQIYRINGG